VVEHCLEALLCQPKIVVFAHHRDVVAQIAAGIREGGFEVRTATGEDSTKMRDAAVQWFQNTDFRGAVVCSIYAMGEGHTLTASSQVIVGELDWVPGKLCQAEDRLHRFGQHDSVLVQHIVLDGSLDARMAEMLIEKQAIIEKALNNGGPLPSMDADDELPLPRNVADRANTLVPGVAQNKDIDGNDLLSPEQIEAVHQAMKILAGYCDGARELDGQGFSKLDTSWGHTLAGLPKLSQRQAFSGRKLAVRYQRQLPANLVAIIKGQADDDR
jgi:hypothetical protein